MQPGTAFTVTGVPTGPAEDFMRRAVLEPFVGPVRTDSEVIEATHLLAEAWRERVEDLAYVGLFEFAGDRQPIRLARTRALACRPAFVDSQPRTRSCRATFACPFCWARRAVAYWKSIDRAFRIGHEGLKLRRSLRSAREMAKHDPTGWRVSGSVREGWIAEARERIARSAGHDLIEWSIAATRPFTAQHPSTGRDYKTLPQLVSETVHSRRFAWWRAMGRVAGAFESLRLTIEDDQWHAGLRRLTMVPTEFQIPEAWGSSPEGGTVEIHARPGREAIMAAVARACEYPAAMLTSTTARLVAHIIDSRRGENLRKATGDFAVGTADRWD